MLTTRRAAALSVLAIAASLLACTSEPDGDDPNTSSAQYDAQQLESYRAAVPSAERLKAPAPAGDKAAGDPALYPAASVGVVRGVNGSVAQMITILKVVVNTPPTIYNGQTKEFFWGPYDNKDGHGTIAAYIKEEADGADFKYTYAFLRGPDQDISKLKPIIWGGSNPDASGADRGAGVTLWDFEANHAFEQANDPAYSAEAPHDRGRFVAMYGRGADEQDASAEFAFVVAVFRDFVSKDDPDKAPRDLDYFYGSWEKDAQKIDFLDFEFQMDVSEPKDDVLEDVGVRLVFTPGAPAGRAEADATGGSLAAGQAVNVTECWDASVSRTYLQLTASTSGQQDWSVEEGAADKCSLQQPLDALGVPSLQSVDPALMAALDKVARDGVQ